MAIDMNPKKILYSTGLYKISRLTHSGKGMILAFHSVRPTSGDALFPDGKSCIETTPERLESVMKFFIANKYQPVSLGEIPGLLGGNKKNFFAVTFDDGYKDNLDYAYPVLKKLGIPFTVYVATGYADSRIPLWTHILEDFLAANNEVEFDYLGVHYRFDLSTTESKRSALSQLHRIIKQGQPEDINTVMNVFTDDIFAKSRSEMLSWEEINQLASDSLVTIGSHTVSHASLSKMSIERVRSEYIDSKKIIEGNIGRKVIHFAYPYGGREDVGAREIEELKAVDCYSTATTTRVGSLFAAHSDYLNCLPRLGISNNSDPVYLEFLINGTYQAFVNKTKRIITK